LILAVGLLSERGDIRKTAQALANFSFDVLGETGAAVSAYPLWQGDLDHPERTKNLALIRNIQREGIRLRRRPFATGRNRHQKHQHWP